MKGYKETFLCTYMLTSHKVGSFKPSVCQAPYLSADINFWNSVVLNEVLQEGFLMFLKGFNIPF